MIIRPYFFGDYWQLNLLTFWLSLLLPFFGPVLASLFQWLLLRCYLANPFRWVKFTLIGAGCGVAVSYALIFLDSLSISQTLCGLIDCGIERDGSEDFNWIFPIVSVAFGLAAYLPVAISQGLAWRSLGLPLARWCLVLTGCHFLPSLISLLLVLLYSVHFSLGLKTSSITVAMAMLTSLVSGLLVATFTGMIVGLATGLFIVPLLRRERNEVIATKT